MDTKKTEIKNKVYRICSTCKLEFSPIIRFRGERYKCCNKCLINRKHKKIFDIRIISGSFSPFNILQTHHKQ